MEAHWEPKMGHWGSKYAQKGPNMVLDGNFAQPYSLFSFFLPNIFFYQIKENVSLLPRSNDSVLTPFEEYIGHLGIK